MGPVVGVCTLELVTKVTRISTCHLCRRLLGTERTLSIRHASQTEEDTLAALAPLPTLGDLPVVLLIS